MNQDPHIRAAVMFGRGRFNAGVIVDPRQDFVFDPADQDKLIDLGQHLFVAERERSSEYRIGMERPQRQVHSPGGSTALGRKAVPCSVGWRVGEEPGQPHGVEHRNM